MAPSESVVVEARPRGGPVSSLGPPTPSPLMPDLHVGLVYGGQSAEHEISILSARNVLAALRDRYRVTPLFIDREGRWTVGGPLGDDAEPAVFTPHKAHRTVEAGDLGETRKVVVEYSQGWLSRPIEQDGHKQAAWRTDPQKAGAGALGDIGSHAEHLAGYVTGLKLDRLCADVRTFVPGRAVDDDANILLRYQGGAGGVLHCSQVAAGVENDLRLRVSGTEATIEWHQQEPNALRFLPLDGPERVYRRGHDHLSPAARHATRLPPGHPEGLHEAFANVYSNVSRTLSARLSGEAPDPLDLDFPTVEDGARGVHFIQTTLESREKEAWVDASYTPPGRDSV